MNDELVIHPAALEEASAAIVFYDNRKLGLGSRFLDNLNDAFLVSGQYIDKMNMQIFDRWGALIYLASKKDEKWDGNRDSKPMPASNYVWKVEITDLAGRTFTQEGIVSLIRN